MLLEGGASGGGGGGGEGTPVHLGDVGALTGRTGRHAGSAPGQSHSNVPARARLRLVVTGAVRLRPECPNAAPCMSPLAGSEPGSPLASTSLALPGSARQPQRQIQRAGSVGRGASTLHTLTQTSDGPPDVKSCPSGSRSSSVTRSVKLRHSLKPSGSSERESRDPRAASRSVLTRSTLYLTQLAGCWTRGDPNFAPRMHVHNCEGSSTWPGGPGRGSTSQCSHWHCSFTNVARTIRASRWLQVGQRLPLNRKQLAEHTTHMEGGLGPEGPGDRGMGNT